MSSNQHHISSSSTSSSSYKSTTVSIMPTTEDKNLLVITTPQQQQQFTSLIETEKSLLHHDNSERELLTTSSTEPIVTINNSVLTDDDENLTDDEINQITKATNNGRAVSPEPSGNLELAGLRDGVIIRVGDQQIIDDGDNDDGGVEFEEFVVGGDHVDFVEHVSTKSIKSSKVSSMSKSNVIQNNTSAAVESSVIEETSMCSSSDASIVAAAAVAVDPTPALADETPKEPTQKKTKVERKTSKAGAGKKSSKNAEISKENISVQQPENEQTLTALSTTSNNQSPPQILIPEDLAKKLGPGESRVFAKVCVANLRRSFGDLTLLTSAPSTATSTHSSDHNNKFSGSNSLEYNRINFTPFKTMMIGGPSSLPLCLSNRNNSGSSNNNSATTNNKLQLFKPVYWEGLFCSNISCTNKSSFSKFDSLVAKNNNNNNGGGGGAAVEKDPMQAQSQQADSSSSSEQTSKQETKKMYCTSCEKQVFQMELIRAEKKDWHKNCFRCVTCRKVLGVDTYQSHNQRLYCKPHFKELFQPKAVVNEEQEEAADKTKSSGKSKLQLIICESQPKELPPDVVRASDTPSTGLEDIQIDVRSKFEMFEGLKEKKDGDKSPEPLVVKRSASVLAKLKKYENSFSANGNEEGVCDEDLHGVDGIELQSEEEEEGDNSVIRDEIKRKLKNPLQALNEIAHFKQMEQVRSKWEEGTFTRDGVATDSRKEELQKFRSRLCQGKSGQLKEMYEKGVETGTESLSEARRAEIEELRSERARAFREMFERGEVMRGGEEDDEDGDAAGKASSRNGGVDLEVFEAGVSRESKRHFEELDKKLVSEEKEVKREKVVRRINKLGQGGGGGVVGEAVVSFAPLDIVRSSDKRDEVVKVNTAELSNKFKFFETYEDEMARKAKEEKRETFKRITPPREDGVVKTEKDYDEPDSNNTYRDPTVVRHGESEEDDTLQKSRTTSKMLSVFRQMEENLSRNGTKDPIIRPLKQFTPPRDTVGSRVGGGVDSSEEEECEEECDEDEEEEEEEDEQVTREDDFLKEVGSLARARSLRAKFERWEQQQNERNVQQQQQTASSTTTNSGGGGDELAESIESAKNLKAKFEAMRLMGDGNKENGVSPLGIKVNRFVLNSHINSSSSSTSTSPQQLTQFCAFNSLPADVSNHHNNHQHSNIMSSNEQCAVCEKRVYVMEKVEAGGKMYHKNCFRCSQCKCILRMDTFTSNKGTLFCTTHFKQLFKIKGNYDEGFGHETQYQQWAKNKQAQAQPN